MARKKEVQEVKPASSQGRGITQSRHDTIDKLKPYFQTGLTINRACDAFNSKDWNVEYIARSTVQGWYEDDDEVRQKIDAWKDTANVLSRQALMKALQMGDTGIAQWWLERREKSEFSSRQEVTGANGTPFSGTLTPEEQQKIASVVSVNLGEEDE